MKIGLPQGVQDYVGTECFNKTRVEKGIADLCFLSGYERIEPTAMEYYDTYRESGMVPAARMFKTTDLDGEILAIRPDATLQIARIVAERYADSGCKRFFYLNNSYQLKSERAESDRECAQFGLELVGADEVAADVEIVSLAVRSILETGITDFQIELGHIDYFYGLVEDFDRDQKERLRLLLNQKDMPAIDALLERASASKELVAAIHMLPFLFGGVEVLEQAAALSAGKRCRDAIVRLKGIYDALGKRGLDKYITFDLGMAKANNYYSGLILHGLSKMYGLDILDGGRYEIPCKGAARAVPAVGFTVWLKRLLIILERQGLFAAPDEPSVGIWADSESEGAFAENERVFRENKIITVRLFGDKCDAEHQCRRAGIRRLMILESGAVTNQLTIEDRV